MHQNVCLFDWNIRRLGSAARKGAFDCLADGHQRKIRPQSTSHCCKFCSTANRTQWWLQIGSDKSHQKPRPAENREQPQKASKKMAAIDGTSSVKPAKRQKTQEHAKAEVSLSRQT